MKKSRFTIGKKIGTGFGVAIFFMVVIFSITIQNVNTGNQTFEESKLLNERITLVETPSLNYIIELNNKIRKSKELITKWATVQLKDEDRDKVVYKKLVEEEVPELKKLINKVIKYWPEKEQEIMHQAFQDIDDLFALHKQITESLVTFTSYEDQSLTFVAEVMVYVSTVMLELVAVWTCAPARSSCMLTEPAPENTMLFTDPLSRPCT